MRIAEGTLYCGVRQCGMQRKIIDVAYSVVENIIMGIYENREQKGQRKHG